MKITSKNYRFLLVIPTVLILFSVAVLVNNYTQKGEWFTRSFELTGGTMITVEPAEAPSSNAVENALSSFPVSIRTLSGLAGYKLIIQTVSDADVDEILQSLSNAGIDTTQYSIQTIGPSLGESFWQQTQLALVVAFILMGIVVFVLFRDPFPSMYVIFCALCDIVVTVAFMNIFGIELSMASLGALLMLLGYSVDTDIMLTTRFLKETEPFGQKIRSAIKTGLTMTGTTLGALFALYISGISPVITQIASVLIIGLIADIMLTWFQNSVLLRMYMTKKGLL